MTNSSDQSALLATDTASSEQPGGFSVDWIVTLSATNPTNLPVAMHVGSTGIDQTNLRLISVYLSTNFAAETGRWLQRTCIQQPCFCPSVRSSQLLFD